MGIETQAQFISRLDKSLKTQEFVKLTLGKYRGTDAALNRIVIRAVKLRSGLKLSFTYCYKTQEIVAPGATVVLEFAADSGSVVRNGPPCTDGGSHERRSAKYSAGSAGTGRYLAVSNLRRTSHNRQ